jgi:PTS system mannose-specific IIA component
MVGIVLISHGDLAKGIISSAKMLTPNTDQMASIGLWPADNPDEFNKKIGAAIKEVDKGEGVFILADFLGGTPSNQAMYYVADKVRMITGLSLPMLYSLLTMRDDWDGSLEDLTKAVMDEARDGMVDVNELVKQQQQTNTN